MQNKNIKIRFFLTHFIIVIPILVASFLITYVISYETMKQNRKVLYQQLNDFAEEFAQIYSDCNDKGILLAGKLELSKNKMTSSSVAAYEGLELLKLSSYFSDSQSNIFVYYQTGKVYSTTGVASKDVFFRDVISCTEESIARAETVLKSDENMVTLIYHNIAKGSLLFSYKVNRDGSSVNFLVPFEKLEKICMSQFYNKQYYELEMQDGSKIAFESNSDGTIKILKSRGEEFLQKEKYKVYEKILTVPSVKIRLYYDSLSFIMNKWLYTVQIANVVLILTGTILTGILFWAYTQKRFCEISVLEKMARGDFEAVLPQKNIYSGLQHAISKGRNENLKLEQSIQEHRLKLQNRIAYMIFGGLYSDLEKVTQAFRELGFLKCPEKFFVGLVSAQTEFFADFIPEILRDCLWLEVEHEEQKQLLFLYEVESDDGDKLKRRQVAQSIRSQLHQVEIRKVRIGMSSVFTDIVLINKAYEEAENVLEEILSGKRKDFFLCWDEVQCQISGIFLEENLLREFDKAIQEQNYEDAVYCFQKLTKDTASRECSPQNRTYLRYVILQHLIQYLQQKGTTEANIFMKECIHIDVTAEKEFIQTITNILYKCLNRKEDDAFLKMQEFIGTHYQNSELTYEEVAAAGGISKTYISKVFRAKLDMSYIEYLTAVRMDKACTLLRTTSMNISEVAKMVGYTNDSSFRRVFKECFGVSASDYRKREKE